MPRLNTAGSALCGIAGQTLSIDGATPAAFTGIESGGWAWRTDTTIFGQGQFTPGVLTLQTYDVGSLALTLNEAVGANWTVAGGSFYAAWPGIYENIPGVTLQPANFPLNISPTGETAILQVAETQSGLRIFNAAGTLIDQQNVSLLYNGLGSTAPVFMRSNICCYALVSGGYRLRQYQPGAPTNLAFLVRDDGINWAVPFTRGSDVWILERNNVGMLTLRTREQTAAVWDLTGGASATTFGPDAILLSADVARVAWCTTIGEERPNLIVMDVNLLTGATSIGTVVGTALSFAGAAARGTVTVTGTLSPGGGSGGGGGGPAGPGATGNQGAAVLALRARPPQGPRPPRRYPHVDEIKDWPTRQTAGLVWDRLSAQSDQVTALEATTAAQADTIAELRDAIRRLEGKVGPHREEDPT